MNLDNKPKKRLGYGCKVSILCPLPTTTKIQKTCFFAVLLCGIGAFLVYPYTNVDVLLGGSRLYVWGPIRVSILTEPPGTVQL